MDAITKRNGFGILVKYHRKSKKASQAALGIAVGVDNSIISKIESGNFIPNVTVVEGICVFLKLNPKDKEELNNAFMQAILKREGIENQQIFLNNNEVVQFAEEFVSNIHMYRVKGMPKLAVAESEQKINLLHLIANRTIKKTTRHKINLLLSQLLMEVSKSYMDFLPPEKVWSHMTPLIKYQNKTAAETKDPTAIMMAKMSQESALYVSKDYHQAHEIGKELHANLNFMDENWHSEIIRASAINAGYLNNPEEVKSLTNDINFFVQKGGHLNPMDSSFILEGLARAQGSVKNPSVMKTIEKAWHYIDLGKKTGKHSALRTVQLIRTQLKIMNESGENSYKEYEKLGNKGLLLSEELGYTRYENEIKVLLDSKLNGAKK